MHKRNAAKEEAVAAVAVAVLVAAVAVAAPKEEAVAAAATLVVQRRGYNFSTLKRVIKEYRLLPPPPKGRIYKEP